MEIKDVHDCCVIDICSESISDIQAKKIRKLMANNINKRFAVNFKNVKNIGEGFVSLIKYFADMDDYGNKLSLFNVPSDIFVTLFVMNYDKYLNLYMAEQDFVKDKSSIVNRRFRLCS